MILDDLAAATRRRIEEQKKEISPVKIREIAESMERNTEFPFEKALGKPGMSFICEVKKASPSKGIIAEDFNCRSIPADSCFFHSRIVCDGEGNIFKSSITFVFHLECVNLSSALKTISS